MDRSIIDKIEVRNGFCYTTFEVECSGDDTAWITITDGVLREEEKEKVQCHITLDEMEYLAKRMLNAVEYQRRHQ